ncbi:Inositol transporter [Thalictrum thalictroides]|uniref:Inositol transporter n=1 Tax=Thalictrum thalictroides TaxID=46969 RepID=A0A7J6WM52_THATH|nr:Inositol transporter [Thalictrum thalictroides]
MDLAYKKIICKGNAFAMELLKLAKYYNGGWSIKWEHFNVLRIVLIAAMAGLIYGYDSGINYSYLPTINLEDDLGNTVWGDKKLATSDIKLTEVLASFFPAGILISINCSAACMSITMDRMNWIEFAVWILIYGVILEVIAFNIWILLMARFLVIMGIAGTLFASPIYIAEVSPYMIRGALVSTFYMFVAGGQLLAYLMSIAFSKVPGTWRWMFALEGVLVMVHYRLLNLLPESPKVLFRTDRECAIILLKFLYPYGAENEIQALQHSVKDVDHKKEVFRAGFEGILKPYRNDTAFRRGLIVGIGCLLAQQLVGINMVMHYTPTLLQMAGYDTTKITNSPIIPGFSAFGYLFSIFFVDRLGRRKLLIISIIGIVISLWMLSCAFKNETSMNSSSIGIGKSPLDLNTDFKGSTSFAGATVYMGWHIVPMIKGSNQSSTFHLETDHHGMSYNDSSFLAFSGLQLYTYFYSLGMGIVPWIINSEIYAFKYAIVGTSVALAASLVSNVLTSLLLSVISEALGSSNTFLLLCLVSCIVGVFILLFVPETKGLRMEDIEGMLLDTETCNRSKQAIKDDCENLNDQMC